MLISTDPSSVRVTLIQPSLAAYRAPVFAGLASETGIKLTVVYAKVDQISNVEPAGFSGRFEPMTVRRLFGHPIYWQSAQVENASRDKCDVLVLNWDAHYASTWAALLKAKRKGVRTVLWGHGYSGQTSWPRRTLRQSMARLADVCVFYNRTGRDLYASLGFDVSRLFIAWNAVDRTRIDKAIDHLKSHPQELDAFKRELETDAMPLLLLVARLVPLRRIDLFLEACAILKQRGRSFQIALVGGGELSFVEAIRSHAERLGLSDLLRMPGAIYNEPSLAPWFMSARVFVFPSYLGLSLQHAFSYSLPVITTDNPHANGPEIEALIHNVNGLTYKDNDTTSLASAIEKLLLDPQLATKLGQTGRLQVEQTYSLPNMINGLRNAIFKAASV